MHHHLPSLSLLAGIALLVSIGCHNRSEDEVGAPPDRGDTTSVSGYDTASAAAVDTSSQTSGGYEAGDTIGMRPDSAEVITDSSGEVLVPDSVRAPDYSRLDSTALLVRIPFGTDRRFDPAARPGSRFGTSAADSLQFGAVWVNVPSYHRRRAGEVNRPPIWRVNPIYDVPSRERDMFVDSLIRLDAEAFYRDVGGRLSGVDSSVFVFVHGYNVSFEDAALRTAQLAADINFPGLPVFYSWASQGALIGYGRDQANAVNSGEHLARFLRGLATAHKSPIHLVAHSMGSEVLVSAMKIIDHDAPDVRFGQLVLIAPDLDVRPFQRRDLAMLRRHCDRVTLYASDEDEALKASRALHGVWRLGLGGDSLVVLPDMDTVDATRVRTDLLGHGSFASATFLQDLAAILDEGRPTPRWLLRVPHGDLAFWRFRPSADR
jgi:esterase/lipase superfamily enzyme